MKKQYGEDENVIEKRQTKEKRMHVSEEQGQQRTDTEGGEEEVVQIEKEKEKLD